MQNASFSSEQEHFTHDMYMTALIRPSDVKIEPTMFYEGINAKVFRHSIAFAIAAVVTSRSSSFEYTMSVHAGAERNVCNIVVSTETPPNFHHYISNAAPRVQTSTLTPAPPQVPKREYHTFICLFRDDATTAKGPGCDEGTNTLTRFRGSSADAHPWLSY